jgi:hypothetical protein
LAVTRHIYALTVIRWQQKRASRNLLPPLLTLIFLGAFRIEAAKVKVNAEASKFQLGVGLTPAHFPHQSGDDIEHMYRLASHPGQYAVINVNWNQPDAVWVASRMVQLAQQFQLSPIIQLNVLDSGNRLAPPNSVSSSSVTDPDVISAYGAIVKQLAALKPDHLVFSSLRLYTTEDAGKPGAAAFRALG